MTLPSPQPGLVIGYSYLWAEDAAKGREEGTKDRPAAVILVVDQGTAAAPRVYVLPITTQPQPRASMLWKLRPP